MGAAVMHANSPTPSPSVLYFPSPSSTIKGWKHFFHLVISKSPEGELLIIELSVLLTTAFLLLLFTYGGIRRHVQIRGLTVFMKVIYILTPVSITYIIGLMHNASYLHELFPVWAFVLMYVYGGVDTMTACDLSDNEQALQYTLHTIPLFFWAGWLAGSFIMEAQFSVPLAILYLMALWNTGETLQALYLAGKSSGLPAIVYLVEHFMRQGMDVPDEMEADPVTMKGYRYFVKACDDDTNITTEDIWRSEGRLLRPTNVSSNSNACVRSERLKDMALSHAWFWLLLRRFAGYTLHESSKQKTRKFVETGFLSLDPGRVERLFQLIEVELDFVFDFFYTKLFALTVRQSRYKLRRLVCVPFFLWFAFFTLYNHGLNANNLSIKYHGHSLEIGVTRIVMVIIATLEVWQMSMYFLSNWKIISLLRDYVKKPNTTKCLIRKEMMIICIWTIKDFLSKSKLADFFFKPWQRKLGQYSLVENYAQDSILRKPLFYLFGYLVKTPKVGQKGSFSVKLSIEVQREIVSSLITNGLALSPGTATLQRNHLLGKLSYACKMETDAEIILVWHIATSCCEFFSASQNIDQQYFNVATQISKYCAYLVTFVPKLLPDHPFTTESVFEKAVESALTFFEGLEDMEQRYQKMNTNLVHEDDSSIVGKSVVLAKILMDEVIGDPSKGWRVLAEFWAELLLYMTPSENVTAHGSHLAQGGEFITHLWALLTHAGVVTRDAFPTTV